jgi:hypothetical protein
VQSDSARLGAQINPNGSSTLYHFDYITDALYQKNLAESKEGFLGGSKAPPVSDSNIGSGTSVVGVVQQLSGLAPDTLYRYRLEAKNGQTVGHYEVGPVHFFRTLEANSGALLPDSRGWELVSPVEKNGGLIEPPEAIAGGGALQASADGSSVTYGSSASFAGGGQGAPLASQYIGRRTASGWTAENISVPSFAGSYDAVDQGAPYQLFSGDLNAGLLLNGDHCRGAGGECAVANPPLPGTDAPSGFQDYYLRNSSPAGFEAVVGAEDLAHTTLSPSEFDVTIAGSTMDLQHVVVSTCAALAQAASEVPLGETCDPAKQNLYEWSSGGALKLINATPGATLAAQVGSISADGSRVYWVDSAGEIQLNENGANHVVGAGSFQTATADGTGAFYVDPAGHLEKYSTATHTSTNLTPSETVLGVLGASSNGEFVYFATGAGVSLWHNGNVSGVAAGGDAGNYPPTTGTARVSADGLHLAFMSKASLTGYDNTDLGTGNPDSEVYLYKVGGAPPLTCVSCNPTNERPSGPASIPGAIANGATGAAVHMYKPRSMSANGKRVFFETHDTLASSDTNSGAPDVYEWEAQGEGSCSRPEGCVRLMSSGRSAGGATFVDASADGSDVFFLTDASLIEADPGSVDLYDARVGGGFPPPVPPIDCEGDSCTPLPEEPVDPTLTTLTPGRGNPAPNYHNLNPKHKKKKHHHKKRHHKRHHRGVAR